MRYYEGFSLEDDLSMMKAQILGHFGEDDRGILADDVNQFKAKLNTLQGKHAVYICPNAKSAFANQKSEHTKAKTFGNRMSSTTLG